MKKYSKKGLEKKKDERKDYAEFYQKHIKIIKQNKVKCEECGCNLVGDVSEVCHILNKSRFKSIATEDLNILYLCCRGSDKNCHSKLDNSKTEEVKFMKIYPKIQERFNKLKETLQEKLTWKDYELFEN
jgi:hypothetical protein